MIASREAPFLSRQEESKSLQDLTWKISMLTLMIRVPSSCNREVSSFPFNTVPIDPWPGSRSVISPVPISSIPSVFAEMSPIHWGPKSHHCHRGQTWKWGRGRKKSGVCFCFSCCLDVLCVLPGTTPSSLWVLSQWFQVLLMAARHPHPPPFSPKGEVRAAPTAAGLLVPWPSLSPAKALSSSSQIS